MASQKSMVPVKQMTEAEIQLLKVTWKKATGNGEIGIDIYNRLFYIKPKLRAFIKKDVGIHAQFFVSQTTHLIENIHQWGKLNHELVRPAINHDLYGVTSADFEYYFNAVIFGLKTHLKSDFNSDVIDVWTKFFSMIADEMNESQ